MSRIGIKLIWWLAVVSIQKWNRSSTDHYFAKKCSCTRLSLKYEATKTYLPDWYQRRYPENKKNCNRSLWCSFNYLRKHKSRLYWNTIFEPSEIGVESQSVSISLLTLAYFESRTVTEVHTITINLVVSVLISGQCFMSFHSFYKKYKISQKHVVIYFWIKNGIKTVIIRVVIFGIPCVERRIRFLGKTMHQIRRSWFIID